MAGCSPSNAPRLLAWIAVAVSLLEPASWAATKDGQQSLDRVVAVVDDDPILASDLTPLITLGLIPANPGESFASHQRRVLDELIAQRLRYHEVSRFGIGQLPVEEVNAQVEALRARFATSGGLELMLGDAGMDLAGLRQLLARQLLVLSYVEERLGPRVFVSLDEIRQYYARELTAELAQKQVALPPLEEVREDIRRLLKEQRLNDEITRWTSELRREADVIDHLDAADRPLPPLVSPR